MRTVKRPRVIAKTIHLRNGWVIELTYGIGITIVVHQPGEYVNTQTMKDDVK